MTSASWSEIVRTITLVSGDWAVMCFVASTPLIFGMFRSMTTTSGASLADELHRLEAVRRLAEHQDALLLLQQVAQPGPEEVVVVHQHHPNRFGCAVHQIGQVPPGRRTTAS